jgi:hypothetical protein
MSIALRLDGAASMQRLCVSQTHLVYEVEPMSIALEPSTALPACSACVCHGHNWFTR